MPTYNKYNFDGKQLGKSRLILAIMKKFVRENNPNYEQLKQNFSEIEKDRRSLFITPLELAKKKEGSKDTRKRFFEADDEALTLSDTSKVYVSNQWSKAGTEKVIRFVNSKFDYGISDVIQQQSINDLYIDYLKDPDKEWITAYQQFTEEVKNNLGVDETDFAANFINKLWKPESNGIASAKPGTLSNEEYQKLIDDLPKITALIFKEPSSNTLKKVYEWADEAKKEGKFKTIKRGVIHRVFAAVDPKKYNTILNIDGLRAFTKYLNDTFDLGINVSWNWAELNQVVTEKIKSKVDEPENELVFNTFIWWLFEKLKQESDDESLYIDEDERDLSMSTEQNQAEQKAVNLIYYGPPGTGKTYTLQKLLKEQYTETGTSEEPEVWLNNKLSELSWFEIITLILLDLDKEVSVTEIVNHEYFTKKLARLRSEPHCT